ncbi:hypothetical protein ACFL6U_11170 [Planctomycetota bacterium]
MSAQSYVAEPALAAAQKYREKSMGIPIDPEVVFSDHCQQASKRCEKRQRKLLSRLAFIRPFLDEDEVIVLTTTACSPVSIWEQMMAGWVIFLLKRSLLVFTNKRIFHVPTNADFSYRKSIAAIDYSWCRAAKMKGSALRIFYHTGQNEQFVCIDARERKKLKAMFDGNPLPTPEGQVWPRTFLCPNCGQSLPVAVQPCAHCGQAFKDRATMIKLSAILPGGGYFYTGHPVLGILDALVETYLSVYVLLAFIGVATGHPEAAVGVLVCGAILALEKGFTIYECGHFIREFIPQRTKAPYETQRASAPVPEPPHATRDKIHVDIPAASPEAILRAGGNEERQQ